MLQERVKILEDEKAKASRLSTTAHVRVVNSDNY
jgi:hypothetical protein